MTKSKGLIAKRGTRQAFVDANQGQHMCACGCGEAVPIKREHFNVGIPRYRHGHNQSVPKRPRPPKQSCGCGCGGLANYGKRFISGHNSLGQKRSVETRRRLSDGKRGEMNPQWGRTPHNFKGRLTLPAGYVTIYSPDHPFGGSKRAVMEHRLVMESYLRATDPASPYLTEVDGELYLRPEIETHHINEVKDDNRIENLQCMTTSEHAAHHAALRRAG